MNKQPDIIGEYRALEARAVRAMADVLHEDSFGSLALDIHGFQLRHNRAYARWCTTLPTPENWRGIPKLTNPCGANMN